MFMQYCLLVTVQMKTLYKKNTLMIDQNLTMKSEIYGELFH